MACVAATGPVNYGRVRLAFEGEGVTADLPAPSDGSARPAGRLVATPPLPVQPAGAAASNSIPPWAVSQEGDVNTEKSGKTYQAPVTVAPWSWPTAQEADAGSKAMSTNRGEFLDWSTFQDVHTIKIASAAPAGIRCMGLAQVYVPAAAPPARPRSQQKQRKPSRIKQCEQRSCPPVKDLSVLRAQPFVDNVKELLECGRDTRFVTPEKVRRIAVESQSETIARGHSIGRQNTENFWDGSKRAIDNKSATQVEIVGPCHARRYVATGIIPDRTPRERALEELQRRGEHQAINNSHAEAIVRKQRLQDAKMADKVHTRRELETEVDEFQQERMRENQMIRSVHLAHAETLKEAKLDQQERTRVLKQQLREEMSGATSIAAVNGPTNTEAHKAKVLSTARAHNLRHSELARAWETQRRTEQEEAAQLAALQTMGDGILTRHGVASGQRIARVSRQQEETTATINNAAPSAPLMSGIRSQEAAARQTGNFEAFQEAESEARALKEYQGQIRRQVEDKLRYAERKQRFQGWVNCHNATMLLLQQETELTASRQLAADRRVADRSAKADAEERKANRAAEKAKLQLQKQLLDAQVADRTVCLRKPHCIVRPASSAR